MGVGRTILFFLFLIAMATDVHCQTNTFVAYEFGATKDEITFYNPQRNSTFRSDAVGIPGFLLTQQLYQSVYIETGVYNDFTGIDMVVLGSDTTNLLFAQNELHIPLRLQLRQDLFDNSVDLFLSTGVTFAFSSDAAPSYRLDSKNGSTKLVTRVFEYRNNYALMEFGVGVDVKLSTNFFAGLRYRYHNGLSERLKIEAQTVTTRDTIPDTERTDYFVDSRGTYHAFTIGLVYRISSLWNEGE